MGQNERIFILLHDSYPMTNRGNPFVTHQESKAQLPIYSF